MVHGFSDRFWFLGSFDLGPGMRDRADIQAEFDGLMKLKDLMQVDGWSSPEIEDAIWAEFGDRPVNNPLHSMSASLLLIREYFPGKDEWDLGVEFSLTKVVGDWHCVLGVGGRNITGRSCRNPAWAMTLALIKALLRRNEKLLEKMDADKSEEN